MVFQEKIVPPGPLPATTEPADVLHLQRTIDSLEKENAWLKEQLARMIRDKAASAHDPTRRNERARWSALKRAREVLRAGTTRTANRIDRWSSV